MPRKAKQKVIKDTVNIYIDKPLNEDGTIPDDCEIHPVFDYKGFVKSRKAKFIETGNPLFAWEVLTLAFPIEQNIPVWVNEYLFKVGEELTKSEKPEPGISQLDDLHERLGFSMKLGEHSPFVKWADAKKRKLAVDEVTLRVNNLGMTVIDACKEVAEKEQCTHQIIQDWYYGRKPKDG